MDTKRLKKAIKRGIETTCEKCNNYCEPLNCKHFLNDTVKAIQKEFKKT